MVEAREWKKLSAHGGGPELFEKQFLDLAEPGAAGRAALGMTDRDGARSGRRRVAQARSGCARKRGGMRPDAAGCRLFHPGLECARLTHELAGLNCGRQARLEKKPAPSPKEGEGRLVPTQVGTRAGTG